MAGINSTMGALLLGVLFGSVGFGITVVQTFLYIKNFPNDHWLIRGTVYLLLCLDTAHVALCWHMMYYFLILNFNDPPALGEAPWSFNISVVMTVVIGVIVQCFYARRIFILGNRNWFLMCLAVGIVIPRFVLGIVIAMSFFINASLDSPPQYLAPLIGSALGLSTLTDCIIAGSLVFFLRSHRTGFDTRTDNFLDKLTYWSVNNGLATSVVSVAVIILFIALRTDLIYFGVYIILSKLYINALLATLNYRKVIRGRGVEDEATTQLTGWHAAGTSRTLPTFDFANWSIKDSGGPAPRSPTGVHIVTTVTTDLDRVLDLQPDEEDREATKGEREGQEAKLDDLENALTRTETDDRTLNFA